MKFSTTKSLKEIDDVLEELGYKHIPAEPKKENGLYDQILLYERDEDEIKVHQKYLEEDDIKELVPLAKRTLEYEGSMNGFGEFWELEKKWLVQ